MPGHETTHATDSIASVNHDSAARDEGFQNFTRMQIAAVMLIGVLTSLVVVLQPLLLGPFAAEGRLTLSEMGQTAMLEALGMAIAVAGGGALFTPRKLRTIIVAAVVTSVIANGVTTFVQHELVLAARFVNGLSVGVLLWVWTGLVTRVALPARPLAFFLVLQTSGALAVSWLLSTFVMPYIGAPGGYACLAGASALGIFLAGYAPSEYCLLPSNNTVRFQLPGGIGFFGLLAVLVHQAGIMAFWVYVLPLGREKGLTEAFVASAVTASLVAQIAGGMCATIFARLHAKTALYASVAASLVGLYLVGTANDQWTFVGGVVIIVFFWMFAPAYQMPYLLEVDPSRRAGMQMITAQLLGLSAGPAIASLFVLAGHVGPALAVSGSLYLIAAILILVTTSLRRTSPARIDIHRKARPNGSATY